MDPIVALIGEGLDPRHLAVLFWISAGATALLALDLLLFARSRRRFWADVFFLALASFLLQAFRICDAYTGAGVNEAVWYHLRMRKEGLEWGMVAYLVQWTVTYALAFIALVYFGARLRRRRALRPESRTPRPALLVLTVLVALLVSPTLLQLSAQVAHAQLRPEYQARLAAAALPVPDLVRPARPKSVVYIYGESMEAAFLDEARFPGLAPNLRALREEGLSLDGLQQAPFTGWTIAGIIASQCGFPALGDQDHVRSAQSRDIECLTDLLKKQGYALSYLNGADIRFAGKDHFFHAHGIEKVMGKQELLKELGPLAVSDWGVYDDDLFDAVLGEFDRLQASGKPFFLSTLTVDTHPPEGHLSKFCKQFPLYGDGKNAMFNAVHCSDRLIGKLVRALQKRSNGDLVIVVGSDHLQSASSSLAHARLQEGAVAGRHNLWFALGDEIEPRRDPSPGTTFDIAPTLLGLMGMDNEGLRLGRNMLRPAPTLTEAWGSPRFFLHVASAFTVGSNGLWSQAISSPVRKPGPVAELTGPAIPPPKPPGARGLPPR